VRLIFALPRCLAPKEVFAIAVLKETADCRYCTNPQTQVPSILYQKHSFKSRIRPTKTHQEPGSGDWPQMQMILSGGAEIFYEAKLPVLRRCGESEAEMISSTANQSSEIGKSVVMKKWLDRAAKKGRHRLLQ
jgi:hypothetical protein